VPAVTHAVPRHKVLVGSGQHVDHDVGVPDPRRARAGVVDIEPYRLASGVISDVLRGQTFIQVADGDEPVLTFGILEKLSVASDGWWSMRLLRDRAAAENRYATGNPLILGANLVEA